MQVLPFSLLQQKHTDILTHLPILREYHSYGGNGLAVALATLALLESLMTAGQQSADDLLTLNEAMDWSGLSADALRKNYPTEGEYSKRRWRRAILPIRDPFGRGTTASGRHLELDASGISAPEAEGISPDAEALDEDEVLTRALKESLAA